MSESILKPCPFCGGEMMFRRALWPSDGNTDAVIHAYAFTHECGMHGFDIGTADEGVIAAWNRRASPDLLQMLHECAEYIAALNGEQDDYCQRARALIARATGEAK